MAYFDQQMKKKLQPRIKFLLEKYGLKGSLSVRNHSTLSLTIKQGDIDFISNYNRVCSEKHAGFRPAIDHIDVNVYWYHEHFDGKAKEFFDEMVEAMKGPDFFDHSDIQSDYFHCSHYYEINIGKWNAPYLCTKV